MEDSEEASLKVFATLDASPSLKDGWRRPLAVRLINVVQEVSLHVSMLEIYMEPRDMSDMSCGHLGLDWSYSIHGWSMIEQFERRSCETFWWMGRT